eukprot:364735-Chlamydomonas_euryale.AAC.8
MGNTVLMYERPIAGLLSIRLHELEGDSGVCVLGAGGLLLGSRACLWRAATLRHAGNYKLSSSAHRNEFEGKQERQLNGKQLGGKQHQHVEI